MYRSFGQKNDVLFSEVPEKVQENKETLDGVETNIGHQTTPCK